MKYEWSSARCKHPSQNLKENVEYFAEYICLIYLIISVYRSNIYLKFAASFKFANVTLKFKQGSRNQKNDYGPISILFIISKIFEKLICRQLLNHFDNILSKLQCGFRKVYTLQHCLILMINK